jgi:hypothetical protein
MNLQQKDSTTKAVKTSGCCFLCDCYLGGLSNTDVDDAFTYATGQNWVDDNAYVKDHGKLISGLATKFGKTQRSGKREYVFTDAKQQGRHWFVVSGGKCVYNASEGWKESPKVGDSWPA